LGIVPEAVFPQLDLHLPAGAAFCAYTDGLIDRPTDPTSVDSRHLRHVVEQVFDRLPEGAPAAQFLAENIVGDMLGSATPDDDVCLAVLHAAG
jgi:hypothetical protein